MVRMGFIKKHPLFFIFFSALLIRLSLLYLDYSWDVNNHMVWARDFWNRGTPGLYETISSNVFAYLYPNYPPLAIYLFALVYPLQGILHGIAWWINLTLPFFPSKLIFFMETQTFLAGLFKLPAIIGDLGLAGLVYLFAKRIVPKNKNLQKISFLFILFNPVFIFNSALWGQIDVLPVFFVLLALYSVLYRKNYFLPAFWLLVSLLIKPTMIIVLPLFIFLYVKKYGIKKSLISLSVCNALFWISFIPFYRTGNVLLFPYQTYFDGVLMAQSLPYVTNGAYNFWKLFPWLDGVKDTALFLGLTYRIWGYIIAGALHVVIIRRVLKLKNTNAMWTGFFLSGMATVLFLTKMPERYTLLPLVFLLIASFKNPRLLKWFVILSIISFLNHYHSWAVLKIDFLFNFLDKPVGYISLSLIHVAAFGYFLKKFLKNTLTS